VRATGYPVLILQERIDAGADRGVLDDENVPLLPVAGLGVGIPATPAFVSARLPLGLTVHRNRYTDATDEKVRAYDKRRNGIFPYRAQRNVARFGEAKEYGWSEDKARHYAVPEREDFGAYVKRRGFRLE
jgi:hypothetical protein